MKKIFLLLSICIVNYACQKEDNPIDFTTTGLLPEKKCGTQEVLELKMKQNPNLEKKLLEIEKFTQNFIQTAKKEDFKKNIPVVFNVLYSDESQNLSLEQLQSQIDVLNNDFNGLNSDYNTPNNPYASVRAKIGITFEIETVNRKKTTVTYWGIKDAMKKEDSGGIAATSPKTKLNIWVCRIGGVYGYAQPPGGSVATDGVVLDTNYTGVTNRKSNGLGRTATHEVGHWLNLHHIWGDRNCGSDYVNDTPLHDSENIGIPKPGHLSKCAGTPKEMYMNYMDYTDDKGVYMFTQGQKERIVAIFSPRGPRATFK